MAAQYRVYDRVRSKRAFEVAAEPGTAPDFKHMRGARQALVVTFKRSGTPVPTPVNFGLDDDGRLYFRSEPDTAKIRRIERDPRVRVGPCGLFAKPQGPLADGTARVLPPEESERAHAALEENWSPGMRLFERGADRIGIDAVYVEVTPA
jgi:PPOX class probable F420-dependent enzyme